MSRVEHQPWQRREEEKRERRERRERRKTREEERKPLFVVLRAFTKNEVDQRDR